MEALGEDRAHRRLERLGVAPRLGELRDLRVDGDECLLVFGDVLEEEPSLGASLHIPLPPVPALGVVVDRLERLELRRGDGRGRGEE